jgi:signal transduction histidine kinase
MRKQLLIWLIMGMTFAIVLTSIATYLQVSDEANELFDFQLKQMVEMLAFTKEQKNVEIGRRENDFVVQSWGIDGRLLYASHSAHLLPSITKFGYSNVTSEKLDWRVYSEQRQGVVIQAAQSIKARNKLIFNTAITSIIPLVILTPILAFIIHLSVRRVLKPVHQLGQLIEQRSANALENIPTSDVPPEIMPMVNAVNGLLRKLEQSISKQREFIADASHELRSPITALKLQLQLAESANTEQERREAFAKLNQRLDRTAHLLSQLLTLARYEPGDHTTQFTPINLNQLAQDVVSDLIAKAENKYIEIGVTFTDDIAVTVDGLQDWLFIMLRNVVDNALLYTPEHGSVDLTVDSKQGIPKISIVDSGPGIPDEELERVFDRFYRCSNEANATGSGLGLPIVGNIALQHGARVSLQNRPEGSGLIVNITFENAA